MHHSVRRGRLGVRTPFAVPKFAAKVAAAGLTSKLTAGLTSKLTAGLSSKAAAGLSSKAVAPVAIAFKLSPALGVPMTIALALILVFASNAFAAASRIYVFGAKPSTVHDVKKNGVLLTKPVSTQYGRILWATDIVAGTRFDILLTTAPTPVETAPPRASAELDQNYPNPFNPSTRIPFTLAQSGHVLLRVFDVNGAHVATVYDGNLNQGRHSLEWTGRNDNGQPVASGMYLYTLTTDGQSLSRKMVVLK